MNAGGAGGAGGLNEMDGVNGVGGAASPSGFVTVEVSRVMGNRYQPRRLVHDSGLASLADSIRRTGLMQPIVVRPAPGEAGARGYEWELVAGERRLRAAEMAGVQRLPALVRTLTDEESAEWALVENVQREDLNPMDRALAFERLAREFKMTQSQIAERVGLDRSTVSNLMRLLELEESIREMVAEGELSMGHARALLGWPAGPRRAQLAERVVSEGWSVRKLELAFRGTMREMHLRQDPTNLRSAPVVEIEKQLSEHLGTKVTIRVDKSGKKGRVIIGFYGVDHFEGVLAKMGMK